MADINKHLRHLTEKQLEAIARVVGEEAVDEAIYYGGTQEVRFMQELFERTGVNGYKILQNNKEEK